MAASADHAACKLVPGFYGLALQALLVSAAMGSLVVKKRVEDKAVRFPRTWGQFLLDSSKQLIGAFWVHVLNLVFAVRLHRKSTGGGDSCDWYWVNIIVDCTLGTGIEYVLFVAVMRVIIPTLLSERQAAEFQSGEYGGVSLKDVTWRCYIKQLSVWLGICFLMKICVYTLLKTYGDIFLFCADTILSPWNDRPDAKLWVVMVFTPLVMNTIQLWIVDNILKSDTAGMIVVEGVNKEALLASVS